LRVLAVEEVGRLGHLHPGRVGHPGGRQFPQALLTREEANQFPCQLLVLGGLGDAVGGPAHGEAPLAPGPLGHEGDVPGEVLHRLAEVGRLPDPRDVHGGGAVHEHVPGLRALHFPLHRGRRHDLVDVDQVGPELHPGGGQGVGGEGPAGGVLRVVHIAPPDGVDPGRRHHPLLHHPPAEDLAPGGDGGELLRGLQELAPVPVVPGEGHPGLTESRLVVVHRADRARVPRDREGLAPHREEVHHLPVIVAQVELVGLRVGVEWLQHARVMEVGEVAHLGEDHVRPDPGGGLLQVGLDVFREPDAVEDHLDARVPFLELRDQSDQDLVFLLVPPRRDPEHGLPPEGTPQQGQDGPDGGQGQQKVPFAHGTILSNRSR